MNDVPKEPDSKDADAAKRVGRAFVSADNKGSDFETREMPVLSETQPEDESIHRRVVDADRPGSLDDTIVPDAPPEDTDTDTDRNTIRKVFIDGQRPGSRDNTLVAGLDEIEKRASTRDEFDSVSGVVIDPNKPGSQDETYVSATREFGPVPDHDDDDEDATAMVQPRKDPYDDLETREVPALKDEWRDRAAAITGSAAIVSDWADEEGAVEDSSLAASVAAASGELPLPGEPAAAEIAGPVLGKARAAQREWARRRFEQRMRHFDALRAELVNQRNDYVPSLATAIGRPMVEALTGEYLPVLEVLRTLDDVVPPLLVEQHAAAPPGIYGGLSGVIRPVPYGIVMIANSPCAPFALPMSLAIDALATGNAVLICGAEHHPRINETMRRLFSRAGFPEGLVQVVGGDSETMRVLAEARPDKIIFDGDDVLAARLAVHCAERGVEFMAVRKVKDTALVLKSADLDQAIAGIMTAAYAAGGLRHGAVERVMVDDAIYDEFRMKLMDAVRTMNSHHAQLAAIADTFNPRRAQVLINDAIAQGARVTWPSGEEPGRWIHWKAMVIEGLPEAAQLTAARLEGPGCVLYRARDMIAETERQLALMPAGTVSVFGEPGREMRERLEDLPASRVLFGDVAMAGASVTGGSPAGAEVPRGLSSPARMLRAKVIAQSGGGRRISWFPYTDDKAYALMDAMEAMYGAETGKRLKAALRLAINPSKRRLLNGEE